MSFSREDGKTSVEFEESSLFEGLFYPRVTKFLDPQGAPWCKVEVLEVEGDEIMGVRPKRIELTTFLRPEKGAESLQAAVWRFEIERFVVNGSVREPDIQFDPTSADTIWDSTAQTWIVTPR